MRSLFIPALCLIGLDAAHAADAVRVDNTLPSYRATAPVTGKAVSVGAHNLDTAMRSWAEAFHRLQPAARIEVAAVPLSSEGLDALIAGRAQLAPYVREVTPREQQAFATKFGYPPLVIPIATGSHSTKFNTHALAIYVHESNPLRRLTLAQLDAIFSTTRRLGYSQDIVRWGQLGLTGEWADRPIHLYGMVSRYRMTGEKPGILYFFVERALDGGELKPTVHEILDPTRPWLMQEPGVEKKPPPADPTALEALDGIVAAVAMDPAGIGYSGFRNERQGTKTLALAENSSGPFFAGTVEDVLRRDYPLSRKVYIAVNRKPGESMDPVVREFLRFVLSADGQQLLVNDPSGYLPLTATLAGEARARLD